MTEYSESSFDDLFDQRKEEESGDKVYKFLHQGGTFQNMFGFTEEMMDARYAHAYDLYQREEFSDAITVFAYLATLNPYVKKYWMALAAAQVRDEDYTNALVSYSTALSLDPNDPLPHYFSAPCYLKMDQRDEAIKALKLAIDLAQKEHEHRPIEERSKELLHHLEETV